MLFVAIICTSIPSQADHHFGPLPVALAKLQVDHSSSIEEKYSRVAMMYSVLLKYTKRSQSLSFDNKSSKIVEALCLSVTLVSLTCCAFCSSGTSMLHCGQSWGNTCGVIPCKHNRRFCKAHHLWWVVQQTLRGKPLDLFMNASKIRLEVQP